MKNSEILKEYMETQKVFLHHFDIADNNEQKGVFNSNSHKVIRMCNKKMAAMEQRYPFIIEHLERM